MVQGRCNDRVGPNVISLYPVCILAVNTKNSRGYQLPGQERIGESANGQPLSIGLWRVLPGKRQSASHRNRQTMGIPDPVNTPGRFCTQEPGQ